MVIQAGYLSLSPEFEQAREKLQSLRDKYAELLEEYSDLTGIVSKNLESEYMMKLGKKEHKLFSCQLEILRLKREISLIQAARNRGEKIPEAEIKKIIKKEFAEYQKQIEEQKKNLQKAEFYFHAKTMSKEESAKIKKVYHDLVRKLHPDLNPALPPGAGNLWEQIQQAYQINDWDELLLLSDLVEELLEGKKNDIDSMNSLDHLYQEQEKITQKIFGLRRQIAETKERVPFSYAKLLDNPAEVRKKRKQLTEQIRICEEHIAELKKIRQGRGTENG